MTKQIKKTIKFTLVLRVVSSADGVATIITYPSVDLDRYLVDDNEVPYRYSVSLNDEAPRKGPKIPVDEVEEHEDYLSDWVLDNAPTIEDGSTLTLEYSYSTEDFVIVV